MVGRHTMALRRPNLFKHGNDGLRHKRIHVGTQVQLTQKRRKVGSRKGLFRKALSSCYVKGAVDFSNGMKDEVALLEHESNLVLDPD
jgi:hypothetical protein